MMKRIFLSAILGLLSLSAVASDCIPSGVTDQYTYFVAVDSADFTSRETGLSGFTVYRSRNGGAATAFTTPTINETSNTNMPGVYELLLDEDMTIDSGDDVQHMSVHIAVAGMAPVTKEFCIARAKITAGETLALSGGVLGTGVINAGTLAADTIGGSELAADAVTEMQSGLATAAALATVDTLLDNLTAALGVSLQAGSNGAFPAMGIVASGTAQAYTAGTPSVTLASSTAMADDDLNGTTILILGSNEGDWQAASIEDFVGSTDIATIDAAFSTAPTGTISYIIFGTAAGSGSGGLDAAGVRAAVGLASANLDTQLSTIDTNVDDIETDTGTTLPATLTTIDGIVDDILVDTAVIGAAGAGLTEAGGTGDQYTAVVWNANWDTEVQSEVTDALNAYDPPTTAEVATEIADALATDTYAEPGAGTPASTTTLAAKINYLYKAWRNLSTQTADTYTLYNDDGSTAAQEAPVSDNGTTFSKGEMVAP